MTTNRPEKPDDVDAEFDAALALRNARKLDEALRMFRAIALRKPNAPGVIGMIAGIEYEMDDLESAARNFRRTTQLSPRSEMASLGVFHSLYKLGHLADAFDEVARYRALRPSAEYDLTLEEYRELAEDRLEKDPTDEFYKELRKRVAMELHERPLKGSGG